MLTSMQQIINAQMGEITALIFLLVMMWVTGVQLKIWLRNPELIAKTVETRAALYFLAGLLFISLTIFLSISWPLEWWTLSIGVAIGFSISVLSIIGSLSFLTALLLLRPWEISKADPIIEVLPRAAAVAVLGAFIVRMIRERMFRFFWTKECTILVLFSIWLFFTTTQASTPGLAEAAYWETVARGAILFLMIVNILRTEDDVQVVRNTLVGAALGVSILAVCYSLFFKQTDTTGRLNYVGLLGDPNDITAFAMLAMPFAIKPFWSKKSSTHSWIFAILYFSLTLTIIYLAQSRGAILSLLVLGISIIIYRSKNKKRALLMAACFTLLYFPAQKLLKREQEDLNQSGASRIIYWKTAVNMVIRHPLTGVGFNDYPNQYETYLTDPNSFESGKRTAHSSWFLVLAETGFIGFFLFFGLYLFSLSRAYKMAKEHPEFLFSLLSYGVAMSFLSHTYLLFPYLIFGFTLVSSEIFSNKAKI